MKAEVKRKHHQLHSEYRGGIVGERASSDLRDAKTIVAFEEKCQEGRVRIRLEPETDHPWDVYGTPESEYEKRAQQDSFERNGVWIAISEYKCPCCGQWTVADSIGMLAGYENPLCPIENGYITDLMDAALQGIEMDIVINGENR